MSLRLESLISAGKLSDISLPDDGFFFLEKLMIMRAGGRVSD
jgi:hypothetical protein